MRASRLVANLVGFMLFVQVVLGGGAVLLGFPVVYHLVWGLVTFLVLIVAGVLAYRDYGTRSGLFRIEIVGIVVFFIQGIIGLNSIDLGLILVVHLTNAFVIAVLVSNAITIADNAAKQPTRRDAKPPAQ